MAAINETFFPAIIAVTVSPIKTTHLHVSIETSPTSANPRKNPWERTRGWIILASFYLPPPTISEIFLNPRNWSWLGTSIYIFILYFVYEVNI